MDENSSAGADRSLSGPVIVAGAYVVGGVTSGQPSFIDRNDEGLRMSTGFSQA